jgi:acid stress chaperone HdeB
MSMNRYLIVSGFVFAFSLVSSAQAQVMLDVTKITCDQFVHHKLLEPRLIAAWLSGYYHGKRDTQVIDLEKFDENLSKLEGFCYQEKNFKLPVMQAVEEVIGTGK